MATLLEIVNNVLPEIGLSALSSVVGNSNQTAVLALAQANRTGRSLAKKDWRILIKRADFDTVSSAESYNLPSDFTRFIHNTEWNEDTQTPLWGPISDEYWQADLSGLTVVTIEDRFQLRADGNTSRIWIRPMPTSAETLTYFYASNGWCRSNGGARQSKFEEDTDVLLLDDFIFELQLKWRLLQAQKREWQVEFAEAERETKTALARDGGMQTLRILGPSEEPDFTGHIPETGFGS